MEARPPLRMPLLLPLVLWRIWRLLTSALLFCMQGFYARPSKAPDGSLNLMEWDVGIPGKQSVSALLLLLL